MPQIARTTQQREEYVWRNKLDRGARVAPFLDPFERRLTNSQTGPARGLGFLVPPLILGYVEK